MRFADQQFDRPVAEQPYADIHQEKMALDQFVQHRYGWLLEHVFERIRGVSVRDEYAVVGCERGVAPKSVADDIHIRDRSQGLCRADIDIAAGDQGVDVSGRFADHLLEQR